MFPACDTFIEIYVQQMILETFSGGPLPDLIVIVDSVYTSEVLDSFC